MYFWVSLSPTRDWLEPQHYLSRRWGVVQKKIKWPCLVIFSSGGNTLDVNVCVHVSIRILHSHQSFTKRYRGNWVGCSRGFLPLPQPLSIINGSIVETFIILSFNIAIAMKTNLTISSSWRNYKESLELCGKQNLSSKQK